jgi:1,4-dihydroxy-2-naphthoate octaprenyltransferase
VNNLRDIETDARAGKRTLAVRIGRDWTAEFYGWMHYLAYSVPFGIFAGRDLNAWVLLPLLSFPLSFRLMRRVRRSTGRELNPLLAATAQLLFIFCALFAAGIALAAE